MLQAPAAARAAARETPGTDLPGLTSDEAHRRLEQFGPNAVPDAEPSLWRRLLSKFWAPVPGMLEAMNGVRRGW